MASLSILPDSQHSILSFLFQPPKRWTWRHLRTLKLTQQCDLPAEAFFSSLLPSDGDEKFEELALEFTKPTKNDLSNFVTKRSLYRRNIFHPVFLRLSEVARSNSYSESSRHAISSLFELLLSNLEGTERMHTAFGSTISFKIHHGGQGSLRCGGALFRVNTGHEGLLATFSIVSDHNHASITAHEALQTLVQGILAYDQNPSLDIYTAIVLRIDRTILQLSMAAISRIYLEELYQGRPLSEGLRISRSELYDLQECDRRREALRLIIGLFKFLNP